MGGNAMLGNMSDRRRFVEEEGKQADRGRNEGHEETEDGGREANLETLPEAVEGRRAVIKKKLCLARERVHPHAPGCSRRACHFVIGLGRIRLPRARCQWLAQGWAAP